MHGRETRAAFLIQCSGVGQRRVSVPADTVEVQQCAWPDEAPPGGNTEASSWDSGERGCQRGTAWSRSAWLLPHPDGQVRALPWTSTELRGTAWWPREFLMADGYARGGVILLGQGASGDSKGGDKDHSTNSMKLQRLSQSKKLHQAKLENFQQKIRDLCFNKRNY